MDEVLGRAERVRIVVFDVDGVLTDGRLLLGDDGLEYKAFHSRDGHGIKLLRSAGVEVGVITGRRSRLVAERMASLGVAHVHQGVEHKREALDRLLDELGFESGACAFVGDDVVDLPAMLHAGLAVAVADAHPLVREQAHWCTPSRGGRGAAREVCELVLRAQGRLEALYRQFLEAGARDGAAP